MTALQALIRIEKLTREPVDLVAARDPHRWVKLTTRTSRVHLIAVAVLKDLLREPERGLAPTVRAYRSAKVVVGDLSPQQIKRWKESCK